MKGCRQGWGTTPPTIPVQQRTRLSETLREKLRFNENSPNARPTKYGGQALCVCVISGRCGQKLISEPRAAFIVLKLSLRIVIVVQRYSISKYKNELW